MVYHRAPASPLHRPALPRLPMHDDYSPSTNSLQDPSVDSWRHLRYPPLSAKYFASRD